MTSHKATGLGMYFRRVETVHPRGPRSGRCSPEAYRFVGRASAKQKRKDILRAMASNLFTLLFTSDGLQPTRFVEGEL